MRDAMVALSRRDIDSVALVHRHALSLRSRDEMFDASGYKFRVIRTSLWARLLYTPISPTFLWHLRRAINTAKPDILHLHLPNPSVFWALILPSARRISWVVHWHADVISSAQGWLMRLVYRIHRPFERAVLKKAKAIVATSSPYRESSQPLREWLDKCHVVPLGVDTTRYPKAITAQSRPERSPFRVLAVGRLTYYKGFRYLVEAAAEVPDIQVNLVGLGEEADQLRSLVTSLKLRDRVSFTGYLSEEDLAQQMADCDCLCLPSIERTEAFGMVLLEAMYFGKATVIGDVKGSGMGWVVDDGITGIKVEPANSKALAGALNRLATNREECNRMGHMGKEKFDRQFEINHAVAGLVEIYEQIRADK